VTATDSTPTPSSSTPYERPYLTQSAVGTPALVPPPSDETVTLTIDGRQITAP
jgi:hypothetical protein